MKAIRWKPRATPDGEPGRIAGMHAAAGVLLALLGVAEVATANQNLGELARKEKARRDGLEERAKIYTNEDLSQSTGRLSVSGLDAERAAERLRSESVISGGFDEQYAAAQKVLGPLVTEVAERIQQAEDDFLRYLNACYGRFSNVAVSGGVSNGAVYSPWSYSRYSYRDQWFGGGTIDNETTAFCRSLWSDIEGATAGVMADMEFIDEAARRGRLLPGVRRRLYANYGVSEWAP